MKANCLDCALKLFLGLGETSALHFGRCGLDSFRDLQPGLKYQLSLGYIRAGESLACSFDAMALAAVSINKAGIHPEYTQISTQAAIEPYCFNATT